MARYRVLFQATASGSIEVEVPDQPGASEAERDAAIEKASQEFWASLCHQCSHEITLGDWEPGEDDDGVEKLD